MESGYTYRPDRREKSPHGYLFKEISFREAIAADLAKLRGMPYQLTAQTGIQFDRVMGGRETLDINGREVPVYRARFVTWKGELTYDTQFSPLVSKAGEPIEEIERIERDCLFVGTENGFFAHDARIENSDNQMFVVGIDLLQPYTREGERALAVMHEATHIDIMKNEEDIELLAQGIRIHAGGNTQQISTRRVRGEHYQGIVTEAVKNSIEDAGEDARGEFEEQLLGLAHNPSSVAMYDILDGFYSNGIAHSLALFHERHAWVGAVQAIRHVQQFWEDLIGVERNSETTEKQVRNGKRDASKRVIGYIQACLGSYAELYKDNRFTSGFRA